MTFQTSQTSLKNQLAKFIQVSFLVLVMSSFFSVAGAQEIIQESVGDSYSLYKAEANGKEVIFRSDRIEIFQKDEKAEQRSFLKFKNLTPSKLIPDGKIRSYDKRIENEAMANVLGVTSMNVDVFERMIYKDVYENVDLIVSIVNGDVDFKFSGTLSDSKSQLEFDVIGDDLFYNNNNNELNLSQSDKSIARLKSNDIELNSGVLRVKGSSSSQGSSVLQISLK